MLALVLIAGVAFIAQRSGGQPAAATPSGPDTDPFVHRAGATLDVGANRYRIAGANEPWLGLLSSGAAPSHVQIADGLRDAEAMGANTVRSITLGTSVGCAHCIEPSLGVFNQSAFDALDYAVATAAADGLRLEIPLTDNWHYYYGGKGTFTTWLHLASPDAFYSNPHAIAAYEQYISAILNHVNRYTGVPLKDSTAVLGWETGNELSTANGTWTEQWTKTISGFIKGIDPRHLVIDGHLLGTTTGAAQADQLRVASVDMYTDHMYPPDPGELTTDAAAALAARKAYFVGEYDWRDTSPQAQAVLQQAGTPTTPNRVNVTVPSATYWAVQLIKGGLHLPPGSYSMTLHAQTAVARPITVSVQDGSSPYTPLQTTSLTLEPGRSTYTVDFRLSSPPPDLLISFNVASTVGTVSLGELSVMRTDGPQAGPVALPVGNWTFQVKSFGDTLSNFLHAVSSTPGVAGDLFWQLLGSPTDHIPGGDQYALVLPANFPAGTSTDGQGGHAALNAPTAPAAGSAAAGQLVRHDQGMTGR